MGQEQLAESFAAVTVFVYVHPSGHWSVDVKLQESGLQGVRRVPVASGMVGTDATATKLTDALGQIHAHCVWAINHVDVPF